MTKEQHRTEEILALKARVRELRQYVTVLFIDAVLTPVFDVRTQTVMPLHPAVSTAPMDWIPFRMRYDKRTGKVSVYRESQILMEIAA